MIGVMIILLNGSINSGKSTVAKLLSKKLPNSAIVEIDSLRAMIEWLPIDKAVPINLENAVSVIRNFANKGLNVIVPYPLSQKNYDYVISGLGGLNVKIHAFTLAPKLDKALSNRGERELSDLERDRIKHHYDIGIANPKFGEVIDNSEQAPEETSDIIISKLLK